MAKSTLDHLNVSWVNVDIEDDSGELDDLSQIRLFASRINVAAC